MVGLVLVSHSHALAFAAAELARGVSACVEIPITAAGGTGSDHCELGTDATDIMAAIEAVDCPDGVVVLMDLGSAVLSTQMAIELLPDEISCHVYLCSAPLVEGAVAAAVQIATGADVEVIRKEALGALEAKQGDIHDTCEQETVDACVSHSTGQLGTPQFVFTSRLKNGLHVRPASLLVKTVSAFVADIFFLNRTQNKGPCSARSINKLALLGIMPDDIVEVYASGNDSEAALDAIKLLAERNFGEELYQTKPLPKAENKRELLVISQGVAIAPLYIAGALKALGAIKPLQIDDVDQDVKKFAFAIKQVKEQLSIEKEKLLLAGHKAEADIFDAHITILEDKDVIDETYKDARQKKQGALYAYVQKMNALATEYRALPGEYMPQRALDVLDIASRVVNCFEDKEQVQPAVPFILYAEEVTPSMLTDCGHELLRGILCANGSTTSHAAILAKTLGIPAISGVSFESSVATGTPVMMDTSVPSVIVNPDEKQVHECMQKIERWSAEKERDEKDCLLEPYTRDGTYIEVNANVGDAISACKAASAHADGVGLLRTEFLFMDTPVCPSEDEQIKKLTEILQYFPEKSVVIRTLDIGGDKQISWLYQQKEENPFLGVRGVRLCLKERALFETHLRAILQAGFEHKIKIMIPMIDTVEELRLCKQIIADVHKQLVAENKDHIWPVPIGIMVETPAAAVMSDKLAHEADFFSIGSNDLTQYCMAAERGNSHLASLSSPVQPSVLRLIENISRSADSAGIPVSVCGEMAGAADSASFLLGLGIRRLSMNPSSIGCVKRMIVNTTIPEAKKKVCLAENTLLSV